MFRGSHAARGTCVTVFRASLRELTVSLRVFTVLIASLRELTVSLRVFTVLIASLRELTVLIVSLRASCSSAVLRFICRVWAQHVQRCSELADIIYSSQTEQPGCDEWQSRIKMEQSVDAMSLKDVQLVFHCFLFSFFVLCLSYHFKWQTVSNLCIFLCCNFHYVNSKMLNEFSIRLNLHFFPSATFFSYCVVGWMFA